MLLFLLPRSSVEECVLQIFKLCPSESQKLFEQVQFCFKFLEKETKLISDMSVLVLAQIYFEHVGGEGINVRNNTIFIGA